jgi:hypothetical protein
MDFNGPTSIDLGQSTSINSFSGADYLSENHTKMIGKTLNNPGWIISDNPEIKRVGKHVIFRPFSLAEYVLKIFRKIEGNRPHILTKNILTLARSI